MDVEAILVVESRAKFTEELRQSVVALDVSVRIAKSGTEQRTGHSDSWADLYPARRSHALMNVVDLHRPVDRANIRIRRRA